MFTLSGPPIVSRSITLIGAGMDRTRIVRIDTGGNSGTRRAALTSAIFAGSLPSVRRWDDHFVLRVTAIEPLASEGKATARPVRLNRGERVHGLRLQRGRSINHRTSLTLCKTGRKIRYFTDPAAPGSETEPPEPREADTQILLTLEANRGYALTETRQLPRLSLRKAFSWTAKLL